MPILYILLAANLGVIIWRILTRRKETFKGNRIALNCATWILAGIDAIVISIIVLLVCMFVLHWYTRVCVIIAGALLEWLLIGLMTQWMNWKRLILWFIFAGLTAGAIWGCYRYDQYLKDITVPESFNYATYTPFMPDTLAEKLDEESSLRFSGTDSLPRMDGATALYPVYASFAQAVYPDLNGLEGYKIRQTVSCSTTGWAYEKIVDGECDIIFVAGPSEEQESYAAEKGVELVYTPIGKEAFVFFVHPDNPVDNMTLEQIRSIYSGKTTKWEQFGVKGLGKILAFQRDEGSGSQTALERFVMRDTPLMPADKENVLSAMGGIVEQVSPYRNHRNAIGFSFRFYCTALMKNFHVKLLSINGVAPTIENIENGTYPLASDFYAVTRSDADSNTLKLLEWITGPQGQSLVAKVGYTPESTER
ncbi:MAG: substrate-binding domain-containing protein [Clostridia bacterium]|nr:substrate-binding domain-containing protein [Clostridia bacterium]